MKQGHKRGKLMRDRAKENYQQNEKTTYGMGENSCKLCDGQRVNIQNIETPLTIIKNPQ